MATQKFESGDQVVLRVRAPGHPEGVGKIVALQPQGQGGVSRRYRVRFPTENFDRSVGEEDLEHAQAKPQGTVTVAKDASAGSSWINSSKIRIGK